MTQHTQEQPTVADDPQARELLRRAFEKTARWQKDFKGFTADLAVNVNGKETLASKVKRLRREHDLSQAELVARAGISLLYCASSPLF